MNLHQALVGAAMRPPVYIAGPYGHASARVREWNTRRAVALAHLAAREGLSPVVPHMLAEAGIFGPDTDPECRASGMAATLALMCAVASTSNGRLWALLDSHGRPSEGTRIEVRVWARRGSPQRMRAARWSEWAPRARARGLGGLWTALEVLPRDDAEDVRVQRMASALLGATS